MQHVTSFSLIDGLDKIDLILVEFNVNDHYTAGNKVSHALEDKGFFAGSLEYRSLWYNEVLMRKLLRIRRPDYPAIVTFNADYIGRIWAPPPWYDPQQARQSLFRSNQEPLKLWISSMYEIPVFSASIWHLPLASKLGTYLQFPNKTSENPYGTNNWHADACCHPKRNGHLILNLVLVYNLIEEEKRMKFDKSINNAARIEDDFTIDKHKPILRDPIYLSPEEDDLYGKGESNGVSIDFTDPNGEDAWKQHVVANEGWTWYADNKDKDKFGLIADDVAGGQHISIKVTGERHGIIEITYVVSYENFGICRTWLDNSNNNSNTDACLKQIKDIGYADGQLSAVWKEKASVSKTDLLVEKLKSNESKMLHICLTPFIAANRQGKGNKFKLLGIRMY